MRDPRRRRDGRLGHLMAALTRRTCSVRCSVARDAASRPPAARPMAARLCLPRRCRPSRRARTSTCRRSRRSGRESTCHGEVWFAWLDGAAVIITASDRWKAKSLASGRDRARVWVGDYGQWKQLVGRNEAFGQRPSFEARARFEKDPALLDRLIRSTRRSIPMRSDAGESASRPASPAASGRIGYSPIGAVSRVAFSSCSCASAASRRELLLYGVTRDERARSIATSRRASRSLRS